MSQINIRLTPIGIPGCACAGCGRLLAPTDPVATCSDCAAIFCETCINDGTFAAHTCDPDDF